MAIFLNNAHRFLFCLLILFLPSQLGKHLWPDWAYLKGIRIDYLSPTIYLTDLLLIGVLVTWGINSLLKLKTKKKKLKTTIKNSEIAITFFLFLFLNLLFSKNRLVAFLKLSKIFELFLLTIYVKDNFKFSHYYIFKLLPLTIIYSSLTAFFQFLRQSSIGGFLWWLGERTFTSSTPGIAKVVLNGRLFLRPYATFPHPNVLGGYLAVVLPLLIQKSKIKNQNNKAKFKNILRILAIFLGIMALFISFSLAAWIVGGLGIVASFFWPPFKGKEELKKQGRRNSFLLAISCLLLALFFFSGKERIFDLTTKEESIKIRQELNKLAIIMIKEYPLTGVGLNNFIPSLSKFKNGILYKELQPAHNIYLLIGAEAGLVGLGAFLWLVWLSYKKLLNGYMVKWLKRKMSQTIQPFNYLAIPLTAILLLGLFDHYFYTIQQTNLLFALVLGMVLG